MALSNRRRSVNPSAPREYEVGKSYSRIVSVAT
jgi:hypothetical protein